MNRVDQKFQQLRQKKKKALIVFLTAGDPDFKKNLELILAFEKEGADFIELGVPFSDPLADGPVIQASSQRSLARGTNLRSILNFVRQVRTKTQIPILLMSYLNPVLSYGVEKFTQDALASGVDGAILPDLPPEEGSSIAKAMRQADLKLVYLLAPTSSTRRKQRVARSSSGFIYYVSITGVTGVRRSLPAQIQSDIALVKGFSKKPVCVGFGISNPAQAAAIARISDGVIVGSAVVDFVHRNAQKSAEEIAVKMIRPFTKALGKAR